MAKKHEELVEEIRLLWCEECANGPLRYEYRPDLDNICEIGAEEICEERTRKVVAHTLSAFRDGRLDEELGVVGRAKKDPSKPATWMVTVAALESLGATELIALRGTGKEEEK